MYDRVTEVQHAVDMARGLVVAALDRALAEPDSADVARHLSCLSHALRAAQYTAAEAVNAANTARVIREFSQRPGIGG